MVTTLGGAIVGGAVDLIAGGSGGKGLLYGGSAGLSSNLGIVSFITHSIGIVEQDKVPGGSTKPFLQNISVSLNTNGVQTGLITGFLKDFKNGPNLGAEIKLTYLNFGATYISFDWIQTMESNKKVKSMDASPRIDKDDNQQLPFL